MSLRHRRRNFSGALLLVVGVMFDTSLAAYGATLSTAKAPLGMTMSEWQGVSCLWSGALGGAASFVYSDVLTVAATGAINPLLVVPLIATGFASGCELGTNLAPALAWLAKQL